MTMASKPVLFNASDQKLEERESPIKPVSGDLVATACLLLVGITVPPRALLAKTRGLSGEKASVPAGKYW